MRDIFEQIQLYPLLPSHHIKLGEKIIKRLKLPADVYDAKELGVLIENLYLREALYGEK